MHLSTEKSAISDDWVILDHSDFLQEPDPITEHFSLIPELKDRSNILTPGICLELSPYLPARVQACPWHLTYSTAVDGFSLRNLYQKTGQIDGPALLIIKDVNDHIFGAVTSCMPRVRPNFAGNGESCVFSFSPTLKVWKWRTGSNYNILKGSTDWMAIGSGAFALWLDSDLYRGRTDVSGTYQNQPLCNCGDFLAKMVEVWTFYL